MLDSQRIFPAARTIKEFKDLLKSDFEYIIFLDIHLSQLNQIGALAKAHGKKLFIHLDLVQGLSGDKFGVEFAQKECNPYGILSTKPNVIMAAKSKGMVTVQRVFLLDSQSFKKSCALLEKTNPDFVELLPGALTKMIVQFKEAIHIPILAGGFIETADEVRAALEAGAVGITTSRKGLWDCEIIN